MNDKPASAKEMDLPQSLQWCKAMLHIHGLLTEAEKEKVDKRFCKRWRVKEGQMVDAKEPPEIICHGFDSVHVSPKCVGLNITCNDKIPKDEVHFVDTHGFCIGKIVGVK